MVGLIGLEHQLLHFRYGVCAVGKAHVDADVGDGSTVFIDNLDTYPVRTARRDTRLALGNRAVAESGRFGFRIECAGFAFPAHTN